MFARFIHRLEQVPMTVLQWLTGFVGVLWIRYLLEAFSSPNMSGFLPSDIPTLVHYTLFYVGTAVLLVVSVGLSTGLPLFTMLRASVFIFPIVWLAPTIDLLNGGARMTYLFVKPAELLFAFLTYFGPYTHDGITLGLRIELGCLILIIASYVFVRSRQIHRALAGAVAAYAVIFFAIALPSFVGLLLPEGQLFTTLQRAMVWRNFLHPAESYSSYRLLELVFNGAIAQVWFLVLSVAGGLWFFCVMPQTYRALVRNIRPERLAHYFVACVLGGLVALSAGAQIELNVFDVISLLVATLVITFAWLFAVLTNDLVDEPIDIISNPARPLVTGEISREQMSNVAMVVGMMLVVGAFTLGSYALFWVLLFTAAYYVYSVPPLRLKRVPMLASVLIGVATLATVLLGFFLLSQNRQLGAFPGRLALLVVLAMTLGANVRDLKDREGDLAEGIRTIPTMLGDVRGRQVIAVLVFVSFMLTPLFIPVQILWIPSVLAGSVAASVIVQKKGEALVFRTYFAYLAVVVTILAMY